MQYITKVTVPVEQNQQNMKNQEKRYTVQMQKVDFFDPSLAVAPIDPQMAFDQCGRTLQNFLENDLHENLDLLAREAHGIQVQTPS